jgi:hypothetical protein
MHRLSRRAIRGVNARLLAYRETLFATQPSTGVPTCRICGCTDARACEDSCAWLESDLCSRCADFEDMPGERVTSVYIMRGVPRELLPKHAIRAIDRWLIESAPC